MAGTVAATWEQQVDDGCFPQSGHTSDIDTGAVAAILKQQIGDGSLLSSVRHISDANTGTVVGT